MIETLEKQPGLHTHNEYIGNYEDVATWAAEAVDGQMRTSFEFTFDGQELYAEDGRALGEIFDSSIQDAKLQAALKPELAFEVNRREIEKEEYEAMLAMARGDLPNTMVVTSEFPVELLDASRDVGGYNVRRKQTMQRTITADKNGNITITTQSLDGSNRAALEDTYRNQGFEPLEGSLLPQRIHRELSEEDRANLPDRLRDAYDQSMHEQLGGEWYAGRQPVEMLNTYDFVLAQPDLLNEFTAMRMDGRATTADYYNLAAALHERMKRTTKQYSYRPLNYNVPSTHNIQQELLMAGQQARRQKTTFSGCGFTAEGELSAEDQLSQLGYGNKKDDSGEDEDQYGSLSFKCKKGHFNRRPRGKLIDNCRSCGDSVKC